MKTKISTKEVIESHDWIITRVLQGRNGDVRIDAKTRFHRADESNFFSKWVTYKYANRVYKQRWGGNLPIDY